MYEIQKAICEEDFSFFETSMNDFEEKYQAILVPMLHFRKGASFLYKVLARLVERGISLSQLQLSLDFNTFYHEKARSHF